MVRHMVQKTKKKKAAKKQAEALPQVDGHDIHIPYHKLISPDKLKPHPANPWTHPESQVKLLARIISTPEIGIRHEIIVSKQSGFIVAGHCRHLAALELGLSGYPIVFQNYASPEIERLILMNDNKIAEFAEVDGQIMANTLVELDAANVDLELTCLNTIEQRSYIEGITYEPLEDGNKIDLSKLDPLLVACPKCGNNFDARTQRK